MARRRRNFTRSSKYAATTKELPNSIKIMGDDGSNKTLVECLLAAGLAYQDPNNADKAIVTKNLLVRWTSLVAPAGIEAVEIRRDTGIGESYHTCDISKPMKIRNSMKSLNLQNAAQGDSAQWIKFFGGTSYGKNNYSIATMYDVNGLTVNQNFSCVIINTLV